MRDYHSHWFTPSGVGHAHNKYSTQGQTDIEFYSQPKVGKKNRGVKGNKYKHDYSREPRLEDNSEIMKTMVYH